MTVEEKKQKFIETWGCLAPKWGITKTMAHIHALLLCSKKPMCADNIMKSLDISRGNICMNMKCLIDWDLVEGISIEGDRKEYYIAEKDMWKIFTNIIRKRKQQELAPLQNLLNELCAQPTENESEESKEFDTRVCEMKLFADKADGMLDNFTNTENSWIMKGLKMMIS